MQLIIVYSKRIPKSLQVQKFSLGDDDIGIDLIWTTNNLLNDQVLLRCRVAGLDFNKENKQYRL